MGRTEGVKVQVPVWGHERTAGLVACKTDEPPLQATVADHMRAWRRSEISMFRAPRLVPYSLPNAADEQAFSTVLLDMYIATVSAHCSEILTNPPHLNEMLKTLNLR